MDPTLTQQAPTSIDAGSAGLLAGMGLTFWLISMVVLVITIVAMWKVFTKAGEAGWKCLIPIYNIWVMWEIVGRPGWWVVWFLIPFVNFVFMIWLYYELSKSFGHGWGFAIGLILLPFIFLLVLAFGSSKYVGPWAKIAKGEMSPQAPMPAA